MVKLRKQQLEIKFFTRLTSNSGKRKMCITLTPQNILFHKGRQI